MIAGTFVPQAENHFRYLPFGVDDVASHLAGFSGLAIEIMTFLENAGYQFESTESEAVSSPTNMGGKEEKAVNKDGKNELKPASNAKETQTTAIPTNSTGSNSSLHPEQALPQDREAVLPAALNDSGLPSQQEVGREGGTGEATNTTRATSRATGAENEQPEGATKRDMRKGKTKKRPPTKSPERSKGQGSKKDSDRDDPSSLHRFMVPK